MNKKIKLPCTFTTIIGTAMLGTGFFMCLAGFYFANRIYLGFGVGLMVGGVIIGAMAGSITLKDDGILYEMPFRCTKLIPYDEVDWVNVDVKAGPSSSRSVSLGRPLIYKMTIVTQQGNFEVSQESGRIMNPMPLYDVYGKNKVLLGSPFSDIERFIREKKGLDPNPLALTEYLREGEAKKNPYGRI